MCVPSFPVYIAFLHNWFEKSMRIETICFICVGPWETPIMYYFPCIGVMLQIIQAASIFIIPLEPYNSLLLEILLCPHFIDEETEVKISVAVLEKNELWRH